MVTISAKNTIPCFITFYYKQTNSTVAQPRRPGRLHSTRRRYYKAAIRRDTGMDRGPSRERHATPTWGWVGGTGLRKPRTTRFRDIVRFIPVFNTKPVLMVHVPVPVLIHVPTLLRARVYFCTKFSRNELVRSTRTALSIAM